MYLLRAITIHVQTLPKIPVIKIRLNRIVNGIIVVSESRCGPNTWIASNSIVSIDRFVSAIDANDGASGGDGGGGGGGILGTLALYW